MYYPRAKKWATTRHDGQRSRMRSFSRSNSTVTYLRTYRPWVLGVNTKVVALSKCNISELVLSFYLYYFLRYSNQLFFTYRSIVTLTFNIWPRTFYEQLNLEVRYFSAENRCNTLHTDGFGDKNTFKMWLLWYVTHNGEKRFPLPWQHISCDFDESYAVSSLYDTESAHKIWRRSVQRCGWNLADRQTSKYRTDQHTCRIFDSGK